ncbi:Hypothetical predicted protein [Olea europaea subsp. europaea]|uniref:Uncharacterized protein n=1 Tax=Olea europaea subsp. europaea TaxID=158383 RepID=A0A8S0SJR1_OLEEU|nr:Hypothetical predicted protein [Olea europaea subsp. europaea]
MWDHELRSTTSSGLSPELWNLSKSEYRHHLGLKIALEKSSKGRTKNIERAYGLMGVEILAEIESMAMRGKRKNSGCFRERMEKEKK